jgi:hypothetical protein
VSTFLPYFLPCSLLSFICAASSSSISKDWQKTVHSFNIIAVADIIYIFLML